jgi:hypothetical protein
MFFSTPHRGANLAKSLSNLLRFVRSERRYMDDLDRHSQTIRALNNRFDEPSRNIALISFWESTKSAIVGVLSPEPQADNCRVSSIRSPQLWVIRTKYGFL